MWAIEHHDNTSGIKHVVSVKRGVEKCISKIPRNIMIQQVQKCVLLGTAHILMRSLSIKQTIAPLVRGVDLVSSISKAGCQRDNNNNNDNFFLYFVSVFRQRRRNDQYPVI